MSTVIPPSTAWAGIARPSRTDSRVRSRRPLARAATKVATATATSTKVSVRLPNSMTWWTPSAPCGVKELSSQRGQVGQPSPDPVRRTAPPVTTRTTFATRVAQANRRSQVLTPT